MSADRAPLDYGSVRHWGGFIVTGTTAFVVDGAILWLLINLAGLGPFLARLIAILVAMVVAWLMHRRITFDVPDPPSIGEFIRFATVAWTAAAVNYLVYAAILLIRPSTAPLVAMTVSSLVAAVVSYTGFRLGVFKR